MPKSTLIGLRQRKLRRLARARAVDPFDGVTVEEPYVQAMLAEIKELLVARVNDDTRVRDAHDELADADAALRGWDVEQHHLEQAFAHVDRPVIHGSELSVTAAQVSRTAAALGQREIAAANRAVAAARRRFEEATRRLEHAEAALTRDITALATMYVSTVNRYIATLNAERACHGMSSIEPLDDTVVDELVRSALQPLGIDPAAVAAYSERKGLGDGT